MRRLRIPRRARVPIAALALALAVAAVVAAIAVPRPDAGPLVQDRGCTVALPVRLFPGAGAEESVRHLVVCSNRAGTATLILNDTRAVWVIDTPAPRPLYRPPTTAQNGSFLDLVGPDDLDLVGREATAVPIGSYVVSLGPAATTRLRVDARLTVAQLVYDQLLDAISSSAELRRTAVTSSPSSTRRALGSCLHAILAALGDPQGALASGDPVPQLLDAVMRVAVRPSSACALDWLQAKVEWGADPLVKTPFADDVRGWSDDPSFAGNIVSAGQTYRGVSARADPAAIR